jgi:uncharacterized protein YebE (UPF0316 family)
MLQNAYVIVAIILVVNIVYVSFSTIRMILTLKGRRYLAAAASTVEVVVYIIGLSIVLDNLDGIQNIAAYAVGYALGIIIGSIIEERLALGYITVNVVSTNPELKFTEGLRKEGFGVTSWTSRGMDGDRLSMQILTPRKQEIRLYQVIMTIDPAAFMVAYEPKHIQGGFWVRQVRKGKLFHQSGKRKGQPVDPPDITLPEVLDEVGQNLEDQLPQHPETNPMSHKPNVTPKL